MQIGCHGDDSAGRSEGDESARQLSLIDRIALCIAGIEAQLSFGCESTHLHAGSSGIIEMLDDLSEEKLTPFDPKAMTERPSF
jgi:hypothetical protein